MTPTMTELLRPAKSPPFSWNCLKSWITLSCSVNGVSSCETFYWLLEYGSWFEVSLWVPRANPLAKLCWIGSCRKERS